LRRRVPGLFIVFSLRPALLISLFPRPPNTASLRPVMPSAPPCRVQNARPYAAFLLAGLLLAPIASLLAATTAARVPTPASGSLLAACAIAFVGAALGGGLQWIIVRDTNGNHGGGAGLSLTLGLCVISSLLLAMSVLKTNSGAQMLTVLGSHALGWGVVWFFARKRPSR